MAKKIVIDFENDLKVVFGNKMKSDTEFCKDVWSSMANIVWKHKASGEEYSASFRYAGGLIAEIREEGDYMDWYCCGPYETVSDEIKKGLAKRGWKPHKWPSKV